MIPLPANWSPECWCATYFRDRLLSVAYRRLHPRHPWLNRQANRLLLPAIPPDAKVLEFGGGSSTRWFARHCAEVITVEHHPAWRRKIHCWLEKDGTAAKVDLRAASTDLYPQAAADTPEAYFDLVLIDGPDRARCTLNALPKLKPGGTLVIDNINRHLPCQSRGPGSLRAWEDTNPEHRRWRTIESRLKDWPRIWTTDGVTDTLLLTKPTQTS